MLNQHEKNNALLGIKKKQKNAVKSVQNQPFFAA